MPKSRQRKKRQAIVQYVDVYRKKETKFGEVNEHVGLKAINKHVIPPKVDRKKTALEREAYRAWKAQCKVQKEHGLPTVDKSNFITEYIIAYKASRIPVTMIVELGSDGHEKPWFFGRVYLYEDLVVADGPTQESLITKMGYVLREFHGINADITIEMQKEAI